MYSFFDRELSWLSFNHRVLQEAKDEAVPLINRLQFLAIYSSNLDEFFRVRVASYKSLLANHTNGKKKQKDDPLALIKRINKEVFSQLEEFGHTFRASILPEMKRKGVFFVSGEYLGEPDRKILHDYFNEAVKPLLRPILLEAYEGVPFLENQRLYLVVVLRSHYDRVVNQHHAILKIPSDELQRFYSFKKDAAWFVLYLDDIIRLFLTDVFPGYDVLSCRSVKVSRDADLYLDDEFCGDLVYKIEQNLKHRYMGTPSRFLYDKDMNGDVLDMLEERLELNGSDPIPGARYHNFNDFFSFPNPDNLLPQYPPQPPLEHPVLEGGSNMFEVIKREDVICHFPYQRYDYVINFLKAAASDPDVKTIRITLYRVAKESQVVQQLIEAVENGKEVIAFFEVKARFDEASNLYWADRLKDAGAHVLYSIPGLKVHTKVLIVSREETGELQHYGFFATGNFNEKTAKIYCDDGLFTSDTRLTLEGIQVFDFLAEKTETPQFDHLLVAPHHLRSGFEALVDREIKHAKKGLPAWMTLKMNSLEDKEMIEKLYEASNAGVKIRLIVRGICCLVPGVKKQSENIKVISIVGRYLEHSRVYVFHNKGEEVMYLASADWMKRNLNRRVEVAFPIYNESIRNNIYHIIETQWNDTVKARRINKTQSNPYRRQRKKKGGLDAQVAIYEWCKAKVASSLKEKAQADG